MQPFDARRAAAKKNIQYDGPDARPFLDLLTSIAGMAVGAATGGAPAAAASAAKSAKSAMPKSKRKVMEEGAEELVEKKMPEFNIKRRK